MPKYVFRNENTGEIFELNLKLAEREEYLKENPNITSEIENKIHAEDLKQNSLFSDIKNNPENFGMRKAKPNDRIRWIE